MHINETDIIKCNTVNYLTDLIEYLTDLKELVDKMESNEDIKMIKDSSKLINEFFIQFPEYIQKLTKVK